MAKIPCITIYYIELTELQNGPKTRKGAEIYIEAGRRMCSVPSFSWKTPSILFLCGSFHNFFYSPPRLIIITISMKDYFYHRGKKYLKNKIPVFFQLVTENSCFYASQNQDPSFQTGFSLSTKSLILHDTYPCIKFLHGSAGVVESVCKRSFCGGVGQTMLLSAVHHGNDCNAQTHTLGYHGEI